jgi:hypothetical protein
VDWMNTFLAVSIICIQTCFQPVSFHGTCLIYNGGNMRPNFRTSGNSDDYVPRDLVKFISVLEATFCALRDTFSLQN